MNYYLDFEATQWSGRIIAIGCVSETGETFYTLSKPIKRKHAKLTKFITNLTHITQEEIDHAPDAKTAFHNLQMFIMSHSDEQPNNFYAYGDCDKLFIENTINDFSGRVTKYFGRKIQKNLIDYAPIVQQFFKLPTPLKLLKVAGYCRGLGDLEQTHNALEDAQMLRDVALYIKNNEQPAVSPWESEMQERLEKQQKNIEMQRAQSALLMADAHIHMQSIHTNKTLNFSSHAEVVDYICNTMLTDKERQTIKRSSISKHYKQALKNNTMYFGCMWSIEKNQGE